MMNKAFENMNELGKTWGERSRRMSRGALRATSRGLGSMARYLDGLSDKLTAKAGAAEATADRERGAGEATAVPADPPATDPN